VIFLSNQKHVFDKLSDDLQIKKNERKKDKRIYYLSLKKIFKEKLDGKLNHVEDEKIEENINYIYKNYRNHKKLFSTLLGENRDFNKFTFPYSFHLNIKFQLATPYISRGDEKFYPHENPISKEHVFKAPYIKASSFRGNLQRSILFLLFSNSGLKKKEINKRREQYIRLFGTEQESIKNNLDRVMSKSGNKNETFWKELCKKSITDKNRNAKSSLYFHDVFFEKSEKGNKIRTIEYINPHSRKERKGKNPISIEAIDSGARGEFCIDYFPIPNKQKEQKTQETELNNDIKTILKGMEKMMFEDGFGAKRSRGYGIVNKEFVKIKLLLNNESNINSNLKEFLDKKEVKICE